jgi:cell wall-associated NlpC family hydrolase
VRPIEKRVALLPKSEEIIQKLRSQVGKQYVWGGNTQTGIKKLLTYYRPSIELDSKLRSKWTLDGFDCSGLLFWATHGLTPRNTSNLVNYGTGLTLSGKTLEEVKLMLKPLDIIVWVGHNLIVLDNDEVIESTVNFTGSGNFSTPN